MFDNPSQDAALNVDVDIDVHIDVGDVAASVDIDIDRAIDVDVVAEQAEAAFWESVTPEASAPVSAAPVVAKAQLSLAEIKQRITPLTLAGEQCLPVDPALGSLLPRGLQRGSTVEVSGTGATSFLFKMITQAMHEGSWLAVVGLPMLGWSAAEEQGVPLHRVVAVDTPPPGGWGTVVAALVDAFDLVLVDPANVGVRDVRRIEARARERGSVVLCLGEGWPRAADRKIQVQVNRWEGLGWGHGHVSASWAQVQVQGRGGQEFRQGELLLAGSEDPPWADPLQQVAVTVADSELFAGSDVDKLAAHGLAVDTAAPPLRRVV